MPVSLSISHKILFKSDLVQSLLRFCLKSRILIKNGQKPVTCVMMEPKWCVHVHNMYRFSLNFTSFCSFQQRMGILSQLSFKSDLVLSWLRFCWKKCISIKNDLKHVTCVMKDPKKCVHVHNMCKFLLNFVLFCSFQQRMGILPQLLFKSDLARRWLRICWKSRIWIKNDLKHVTCVMVDPK